MGANYTTVSSLYQMSHSDGIPDEFKQAIGIGFAIIVIMVILGIIVCICACCRRANDATNRMYDRPVISSPVPGQTVIMTQPPMMMMRPPPQTMPGQPTMVYGGPPPPPGYVAHPGYYQPMFYGGTQPSLPPQGLQPQQQPPQQSVQLPTTTMSPATKPN